MREMRRPSPCRCCENDVVMGMTLLWVFSTSVRTLTGYAVGRQNQDFQFPVDACFDSAYTPARGCKSRDENGNHLRKRSYCVKRKFETEKECNWIW